MKNHIFIINITLLLSATADVLTFPVPKAAPTPVAKAATMPTPAPKTATPTTTTKQFSITISFPYAITIQNTSHAAGTITGISFVYTTSDEPTVIKTFNSSSLPTSIKIDLPAYSAKSKGLSFSLKPTIITKAESITATFNGISSVSIDDQAIALTPPWTRLSTDAIYVTKTNNKWQIDAKAMKKSANQLAKPTTDTEPTVSTKTVVTATAEKLQRQATKKKPKSKKSKTSSSSKKAIKNSKQGATK